MERAEGPMVPSGNKSGLDRSWRSLENEALMRSERDTRSLRPDKKRGMSTMGPGEQEKMHGLRARCPSNLTTPPGV